MLRQVKTNAAIKQTYFKHGDRKRQLARERQRERETDTERANTERKAT